MKRVVIILSEGFEEMEAITTIDILRRANCGVEVLGLEDNKITGAHGITIMCDDIFDYYNSLDYDALVLVGGMKNAINLSDNDLVLKLIENFYEANKLIAGICATPAVVFSKTKILSDNKYTCYPSGDLIIQNGRENFVDERVVISNNIITSQSPATAGDFALSIAKYLECDVEELIKGLQGK